jgi:hypothetical protein
MLVAATRRTSTGWLLRADPGDFTVFQGGQQLALDGQRQVGNLVQVQVPPLAEPNQPARLLAVPPWLPAL